MERVEEYCPRRSSFSDRVNIDDLGDLPGMSNDKDESQARTKKIRM